MVANKAVGEAAEAAFEKELIEQGVRYKRRPYVEVPGFTRGRYPDFAIYDDAGKLLYYVEVKGGLARYRGMQALKDAIISKSHPVIVVWR